MRIRVETSEFQFGTCSERTKLRCLISVLNSRGAVKCLEMTGGPRAAVAYVRLFLVASLVKSSFLLHSEIKYPLKM